jgi:hypothetical protein
MQPLGRFSCIAYSAYDFLVCCKFVCFPLFGSALQLLTSNDKAQAVAKKKEE